VEDLKQKRHKVEAHKEAVQLYTQEEDEKSEGARMLSRQVQDHIQKKYGVGPSF
jgi:ATP-dependent Clp protease ATP-binding subunit ClpA